MYTIISNFVNKIFTVLFCVPVLTMILCVASRKGVQHHEAEEPQHGRGPEEEIGDETPSSGQSGGQEDLLCQFHRYL